MIPIKEDLRKIDIGMIGETWVMYQLALRGIFSQKQNSFFDYDLLTNTSVRIEVKTSTIHTEKPGPNSSKDYTREFWSFANQDGRDRDCDFYCFVCLGRDFIPLKTYVIPAKVIGERSLVSISCNPKRDMPIYGGKAIHSYMNNFELIA